MNRAWETAKTVLTIIVAIAAVVMLAFTIISATTLNQAQRSIFGKHLFIVMSDSMSATDFSSGDLVVSDDCEAGELAPGDIISFSSENPGSFGEILTHKIRSVTTDSAGMPSYVTYGTTTGTDDETPVPFSRVIGKFRFSIPKVGYFLDFMKSVPGYFVCILLPFLILIALQAANVVRAFRDYRSAELVKMHDERRSLQRERAEAEALRRELEQMRAQMANGGVQPFEGDVQERRLGQHGALGNRLPENRYAAPESRRAAHGVEGRQDAFKGSVPQARHSGPSHQRGR